MSLVQISTRIAVRSGLFFLLLSLCSCMGPALREAKLGDSYHVMMSRQLPPPPSGYGRLFVYTANGDVSNENICTVDKFLYTVCGQSFWYVDLPAGRHQVTVSGVSAIQTEPPEHFFDTEKCWITVVDYSGKTERYDLREMYKNTGHGIIGNALLDGWDAAKKYPPAKYGDRAMAVIIPEGATAYCRVDFLGGGVWNPIFVYPETARTEILNLRFLKTHRRSAFGGAIMMPM